MNLKKSLWLIIPIFLVSFYPTAGASYLDRLLTDIDIAYIYENEAVIDWPLIYYLGAEKGCHISLITAELSPAFDCQTAVAENYNLTSACLFVPDTTEIYFDSAFTKIYSQTLPDLVIFASVTTRPEMRAFENYLLRQKYDTSRIFNIGKYYRREIKTDSLTIYFNRKQYLDRYFEEIDRMAGSLFIRPDMAGQGDRYSTYTVVKINLQSGARQPEFLSGLDPLKLSRMIAKYVGGSYSRSLIDQNRDNYIQYLQKARRQTGNTRIESLMIALSMFQKMRHQYLSDKGASASSPFGKFLDRTIAQVTAVIFKEAGIKQKGETLIRDSSEGRKLKFISEIDNDGPNEITCGPLTFKPYWLDTAITIDADRTTILPYNSFIKEYLVPVQPYQLETFQPESLLFSGRIEFKNNPFDFRYSLNTYEKSPLKIEFAPYFIVIKPFPKLQVDRLVEPAGITLLIRKPSSYAGSIRVEVLPFKGMKLGAFNTNFQLSAGDQGMAVKVPLVISHEVGFEKQRLIANLIKGNKILASDTAYLKIADFDIKTGTKIALLPDSSGLLEDILVMTKANYRTISDRFLIDGDLDLYDLVILGTGCLKQYKSLEFSSEKLRKYMEFGGQVLVFGQPDNWRNDLLPVSIIPTQNRLAATDLELTEPKQAIFKTGYEIDVSALLQRINVNYFSYPAVIFPAEKIITGRDKVTLFSISKFGRGRFIYCGIPLLEMFGDLDTEAIKLFSNLINYSGS